MRARLVVPLLAIAIACGAVTSCSGYSSSESPPTDAGPDADAAPSVVVPPAPPPPGQDAALDAGDDALGENVVSNGDFEVGCAGFSQINATVTEITSSPHGGTRACKVCVAPTGGDAATIPFYFGATVPIAVHPGETWAAEMWLRAPGAPSTTLTGYQVYIKTRDATNATIETKGADGPVLNGTWVHAGLALDVTKEAGAVGLAVQGNVPPNLVQCIVVDDFSLYRTK